MPKKTVSRIMITIPEALKKRVMRSKFRKETTTDCSAYLRAISFAMDVNDANIVQLDRKQAS